MLEANTNTRQPINVTARRQSLQKSVTNYTTQLITSIIAYLMPSLDRAVVKYPRTSNSGIHAK